MKSFKRYSSSEDKVVKNPNLSVKQKSKILGRSVAAIYTRMHSFKNQKVSSKTNIVNSTNKQNPISFIMNGININITGVSKLDINGDRITIN